MQVVTQIGTNRNFQLRQAVLIYEDQAQCQKFATVHEIAAEPEKQVSLGPGTLLTPAFLERLYQGLEWAPRVVLLPENVLACTSDLLCWWTPSRLHRIFFSDGAEDRQAVNGKICPHPALVWKVKRGHLFLRALCESSRPEADRTLMVAPYWNTEPQHGGVCEGDMPRPRHTDLTTLLEWEEGFFNSRFTHPSGMGKLTTHPGCFMGLWQEMTKSDHFPARNLVRSRQTLQQFVEA